MTRWILELNQPPTRETLLRCQRFSNFALHIGSPWNAIDFHGDTISVRTPAKDFLFDFVIIGTGFVVDLSARQELSLISEKIATWRDRFTPPPGEDNAMLAAFPYLDRDCRFVEKVPGAAPYVQHIYDFTFATMPSVGLTGASISGLKYGVRRLVHGITSSLFVEDGEDHCAELLAYAEPELSDFDISPNVGIGSISVSG
jgi:cation diffusion facilitator CzcD-associated flavoprotein CzcO